MLDTDTADSMVKVKACLASELPPGIMRGLSILGHQILVANVEGIFYAVDGICPNDGGNLANGSLIGHVVKCPLDGSSFDLRTGELVKEPWSGTEKRFSLRPYRTSHEAGCVTVDV